MLHHRVNGYDMAYIELGEGPPFGSRMPLDGPPYLEDVDLELIGDWIVEGAHDN